MKNKGGLPYDRILKIAMNEKSRVHFVGIGGVSMYSLALATMHLGAQVTGSDREENERTAALRKNGITVRIGHTASAVAGASLVVYSHAVSGSCPELLAAKNLDIPFVSRAEYMGALMIKYKRRIGVSGTHGKSTVTAMLDLVFERGGASPTTLSGAKLSSGESYKSGGKELLIYEACEYRDSFLRFSPSVAIALNLELDHTDYFPDIEALRNSFSLALSRASDFALINIDDENLAEVKDRIDTNVLTFGSSDDADYVYKITAFLDTGYRFSLAYRGKSEEFTVNIIGVHNVLNAAATAACAIECGLEVSAVREALASFRGIAERLQLAGKRRGRAVYFDYAHHPTEIEASINALKLHTGGVVTVVFRPHTYSRTASLFGGFVKALSLADSVVLTEIYAAREEPIPGVSSAEIARAIGSRAICLPDPLVLRYLDEKTYGTIVIMGAGDLSDIKRSVLT